MPLRDFFKYQGLGNDFILFELDSDEINLPPEKISQICDRKLGIGADGVLLFHKLTSLKKPDIKVGMTYFNADGSLAETCYNGLRCIALHAKQANIVERNQVFTIDSDAGLVKACVKDKQGMVTIETEPDLSFSASSIGLNNLSNSWQLDIQVAGESKKGNALSLGNPHFVSWMENVDLASLDDIIRNTGESVENSNSFSNGVNYELASVESDSVINMAVWERGSGRTLACGSGAAATVIAAIINQQVENGVEVEVRMPGGSLFITADISKSQNKEHQLNKPIIIKGIATHVFSGIIEI